MTASDNGGQGLLCLGLAFRKCFHHEQDLKQGPGPIRFSLPLLFTAGAGHCLHSHRNLKGEGVVPQGICSSIQPVLKRAADPRGAPGHAEWRLNGGAPRAR